MAEFLHGIYYCAIIKMPFFSPAEGMVQPFRFPSSTPLLLTSAGYQIKKLFSFLLLLSLLFFGCNNGNPTIPNFKADIDIELVSVTLSPSPPFDMLTVFFQIKLSEYNGVYCQVTELEYRFYKDGVIILTEYDPDIPFMVPGGGYVLRYGAVWFFLTEDDPFDSLWVQVVGTDANENSIRVSEGFSYRD